MRYVMQFIVILIYITGTEYIYFSGSEWSYVACLMGSFGTLGLYAACQEYQSQGTFTVNYQEILEIAFAIVVQTIVDASFLPKAARDCATQEVEKGMIAIE